MRPGTTPTLKLKIEGIGDITTAEKVELAFKQGMNVMYFEPTSVSADEVTIFFTQEDTFKFKASETCNVQARVKFDDDAVVETNVAELNVFESLFRTVI